MLLQWKLPNVIIVNVIIRIRGHISMITFTTDYLIETIG